jgi:hypothetical protein
MRWLRPVHADRNGHDDRILRKTELGWEQSHCFFIGTKRWSAVRGCQPIGHMGIQKTKPKYGLRLLNDDTVGRHEKGNFLQCPALSSDFSGGE